MHWPPRGDFQVLNVSAAAYFSVFFSSCEAILFPQIQTVIYFLVTNVLEWLEIASGMENSTLQINGESSSVVIPAIHNTFCKAVLQSFSQILNLVFYSTGKTTAASLLTLILTTHYCQYNTVNFP